MLAAGGFGGPHQGRVNVSSHPLGCGDHVRKRRIESLTDLLLGLALPLTALALILRSGETVEGVFYSLFWFTFSFLPISVWLGHSRLLEHIDIESRTVLRLSIILLLVFVEPYLFSIMAFGEAGHSLGGLLDATSTLYALCIGGIWLILGALHHQAAKGGGPVEMIRMRNDRLVDEAISPLPAAPMFREIDLLNIPARFWTWFLSVPSGSMLDAARRARR